MELTLLFLLVFACKYIYINNFIGINRKYGLNLNEGFRYQFIGLFAVTIINEIKKIIFNKIIGSFLRFCILIIFF